MIEYYVSANNKYTSDNNLFFKNESTLLDENGENIDAHTFKQLIKKETANFIHQNYSNIIVLVGAGASVVVKDDGIDVNFGKTVSMLADLINAELKKDSKCFSLQELADFCKYNVPVENVEEDKLNPQFNLEDFLSDLLSFEKYVPVDDCVKYQISKNKIFDLIISNTSYDFDNKCLKHAAFINTVSHLVKTPSKLSIVTTNYDTLIEDAADSIGYTVIDGFTFAHRPHFDSDMFEWNLVKDIENIKTREMEYKKNIINLLKLHGSLTWERCNDYIYRKDKCDVKNPIMIFPSSNKYMQSYQEPYFELFIKFQELLKRPNTLLITTGFSFADNHISQMIIQAILHNKSLATLISDYNISQDNENWIRLQELMKHNYQIAFLRATMNSDLVDYLGEYYDD
ncbi:SIR2 family protein [Roseburia sp. MUC/MUC-530-WT-4D]|uniref:SIR2 family protein n=1 Tax=Roseburia porci TaxID=2605790 RepID=A0A6L5YSY2_9FIRM|nr:SIR2 family protein [Roseburia porci]MST75448.1 SIR2 family protein [Roseburia porci]